MIQTMELPATVPVEIVRAVAAVESSGGRDCVSANGRYWGPMQVSRTVARRYGHRGPMRDLCGPAGYRVGTAYLADLYREIGDWSGALTAYCGGSRRYAKRVLRLATNGE
jgi:soluble lytic murein transglycosylase-like protein